MAAMEAMSFGKPTMCYLMPAVLSNGVPGDCPIVNTSPDNLKENLEQLITTPQLRHDLGVRGRHFVEKYHDADNLARHLVDIYQEVRSSYKIRTGASAQQPAPNE
jgi:glycosyltransferase involved in cell wall biosynthesis